MDDLNILYKQNYSAAKHELGNYGCKSYDFNDLYHDAFLIFIERQELSRIAVNYPRTYIVRICKYLWFKERKRLAIHEMIEEADLYFDPEEHSNDELMRLLITNLKKLSAICQKILTLYAFGYSEQKIESLVKLGELKMVNNKKQKCKERLRKLIINDPLFKVINE
jgi:DNA-directed RNA polymerase specialized sigma24 family protein